MLITTLRVTFHAYRRSSVRGNASEKCLRYYMIVFGYGKGWEQGRSEAFQVEAFLNRCHGVPAASDQRVRASVR